MRQTSDPAGHFDTHRGWHGGYTTLMAVDVPHNNTHIADTRDILWSHGYRQNACTNSGPLPVSLRKHRKKQLPTFGHSCVRCRLIFKIFTARC